MTNIFTANRIAAICTFLSGLAAFILGVAHTLPGKWPNYALIAAGLLTKLATGIHFMTGSQKYDALIASSASSSNAGVLFDSPPAGAVVSETPESAITPDQPTAGE